MKGGPVYHGQEFEAVGSILRRIRAVEAVWGGEMGYWVAQKNGRGIIGRILTWRDA